VQPVVVVEADPAKRLVFEVLEALEAASDELGLVGLTPRKRPRTPTPAPPIPHPKARTLLETPIRQSTNPGETILDPFCGSGTTGSAARNLGRHALLADISTAAATRRLRIAHAHPGSVGQ
jgi:DNA modification methylase